MQKKVCLVTEKVIQTSRNRLYRNFRVCFSPFFSEFNYTKTKEQEYQAEFRTKIQPIHTPGHKTLTLQIQTAEFSLPTLSQQPNTPSTPISP